MDRQYKVEADEEAWLRRHQQELGFFPRHPHVERACAVEVDEASHGYKFNRVYAARQGGRIIRHFKEPNENSPSLTLWKKPNTCTKAIESTCRLRVRFRMEDFGNEEVTCWGTGFQVGDGIIFTAGHVLNMDDKDEGYTMVEVIACHGTTVIPLDYEDPESGVCFEVQGMSPATDWDDLNFNHGRKGLPTEGSDLVILKGDRRSAFLLPASPTYLTNIGQDKVDVFSPSFPGVDAFLKGAKEELTSSKKSKIWDSYKSTMQFEISKAILKLAMKNSITEDDVKEDKLLMAEVEQEVKLDLLYELQLTFSKFMSGMMTCSVGRIVYEEGNDIAISSRTSLLYGSSGAPLCPMQIPGYFIGCHSYGSAKNDMNMATSADNPTLVREYLEHVLPALPPQSSNSWEGMDLQPFYHWVFRHRIFACDCSSTSASMWFQTSEQFFGLPSSSLKRKRDDIEKEVS